MGSQMMAAVQTNAPMAGLLLERAPARFEGWEQQLSRFRPDSELNLLNQAGGEPMKVSPELWEVLQVALDAARETDGLVTPAVLDALEAAGYDRTFEAIEGQVQPRTADTTTARVADWREIKLDVEKHTVQLPPGVRLDFGGVAKGWAADRMAAELATVGPALVDAGGDIAVSGPMEGGEPWPIGVDSPFAPGEQLELLRVQGGGVATSGRDYRRWRQGGREAHHIIDPRMGEPAATDLLSVTVLGPSTVAAEVAAKTVLILGSEHGLPWLEARPELAGLLVLEDGALLETPTFAECRWQ
jgi:thiamine biosynthesis lipoprotein